jgi:hypothetical protein
MTTLTKTNGLFTTPPKTKLLGEIITWSCAKVSIRHIDLIEALRDSGLDESVARELAPRHAFARACKKLSEARIIRQVAEDDSTIKFQFTAEHRDGDHFSYDLETMLKLDKGTGKVTCGLPGLATLAQDELDRCLEARTGSDLTRIIQRLFERRADLFPIRDQGGAYFCAQEHVSFVDKVQVFLSRLNGRMNRFPVPAGTLEGDRSVKDSVAAGLAALIAEHQSAIAAFGEDTRASTLERAAERIRMAKFKVEVYASYLAEEKDRLEEQLADAAHALRAKIETLASAGEPLAATC